MQSNFTEPRDLSVLSGQRRPGDLPPRPPYPWKTRILLPLLLVITFVGLLGYSARKALWPATDVNVVPVVVKAGTESISAGTMAQAAGWIEADPYPIAVTALADGVVKEVLVLEGEPVAAEQVVARLIDDDARLTLAKAQAKLDQREAELTAAQRQWDNPVERTRGVAAAEALIAESKAELLQLDPQTIAEAARAKDLEVQLELTKKGYEVRAASEIEYQTLKHKLDAQRATFDALKAKRLIMEAQLQQREAELAAAKENQSLRIEETKTLAIAKAAVAHATALRDEAKLRLERMQVRSPMAGVVLTRHVEPGSKLLLGMDDRHSATAMRIYDPKKLQVRVDVPLGDAAKIGVGMAAEIVVNILPDQSFKGVVTRIVNEADLSKNTLQFKVAVKDPSPQLKPEMLARVKFFAAAPIAEPGRSTGQLIYMPESLVVGTGDTATTWVVDRAKGTAQRRPIVVGTSKQDGWVSVTSGVSPGDQLIADPSALTEGSRVRIVGETDVQQGGSHGVH